MNKNEILQFILDWLNQEQRAQNPQATESFADHSLDSLDATELLLAVEDQFGITVKEDIEDPSTSFNDVAEFVMRNHTVDKRAPVDEEPTDDD